MCNAHIAMQELQAVAMMLYKIAFQLSGKVTLYLDKYTAKAYLFNQGGTVSPFLWRLVCKILSLRNRHSISLIQAYIPTHLNAEADYLYWERLLLEWHLLPDIAQATFQLWSLPGVDLLASSNSTWYQQYHTWEMPLPLGVECIPPSLDVSGKLCLSSSCISSSSSVKISGRTCHRSIQTSDSSDTMLE